MLTFYFWVFDVGCLAKKETEGWASTYEKQTNKPANKQAKTNKQKKQTNNIIPPNTRRSNTIIANNHSAKCVRRTGTSPWPTNVLCVCVCVFIKGSRQCNQGCITSE